MRFGHARAPWDARARACHRAELLRVERLLVERVAALAQRVLERIEERAHRGEADTDVNSAPLPALAVARRVERGEAQPEHDGADAHELDTRLRLAQDDAREERGPDGDRRVDDAEDGGAGHLEPDRRAHRPEQVADRDRYHVPVQRARIALAAAAPPADQVHEHHTDIPVEVGQARRGLARAA
eukprot:2790289-Prymnesium_polylepis.1